MMDQGPLVVIEDVAYHKEGDKLDMLPIPTECVKEIARLQTELQEYQHSFDLRWNADMRAIRRWQAEGVGREQIWPDHADMVVWLLNKLPSSATCEVAGPLTIPSVLEELKKPTASPMLDELHTQAIRVILYFQSGIENIATHAAMPGITRARLRHLAVGVKFRMDDRGSD
jgi:hypothetical protein